MARVMKWAAAVFGLLTAGFSVLYFRQAAWAFSWAITFGTFFYHFAMRLLVGHLINRLMGNRADYKKPWYQLRVFEEKLYRLLQVKKWKGHMPSYDPSLFDPRAHSWDAIAQAMCQAEVVHEVIVVLSFVPLFFAIPFGSPGVFLITSLLAACYDLCFVLMQRFNRPRLLRLIQKSERQTNA